MCTSPQKPFRELDEDLKLMIMSRVLRTEIDHNVSICAKHTVVLGKQFYKYVGYKCSWSNHENILRNPEGFRIKRVRYNRNLKPLSCQESFFLHTHKNLFLPFGSKICYDCRRQEVEAILAEMNPDEFSTPILFQNTLALWNAENDEDEERHEQRGAMLDEQIIASISPRPGSSLQIPHISPAPSAPMLPTSPHSGGDQNLQQISSQLSDLSVTPSSISTTSSIFPSQLDINTLTRDCLKQLLNLGGWKLSDPPPAFILENKYEKVSSRRQRSYKSLIGRCVASVIKLTTEDKSQARNLWNIIRESDIVRKLLPESKDPGLVLSEFILATNNANSKTRRSETISMFAHLYTAIYLKSFNITSNELDGKFPKHLRFNPPLTDREIAKARLHRYVKQCWVKYLLLTKEMLTCFRVNFGHGNPVLVQERSYSWRIAPEVLEAILTFVMHQNHYQGTAFGKIRVQLKDSGESFHMARLIRLQCKLEF